MIEIVPVAEHHAEGFRACLDAAQLMAVEGDRVVGWADVLPGWANAVAHVDSLGMGVLPA